MTFVFTYQREEMLQQVLENVEPNHLIINDGSSYRAGLNCFHTGKKGFWKKFDLAFRIAKHIKDDLFIFMPDDFLNLDMERVKEFHSKQKEPYACNIIRDNRMKCFNGLPPIDLGDFYQCFFVDCGFFCNHAALERIGFYMEKTLVSSTGSGVGRQLTRRFLNAKVKMFLPKKSFAFHGDHPSVMHPHERKRNPLISK